MDLRLFVVVAVSAMGLTALSFCEEEWEIWGGENSNRAGFRLGHHEYGICVESDQIKVTCEAPEETEERHPPAEVAAADDEVAIGDEVGVPYYMEFEKSGIRHDVDFGRFWGLEACQIYSELWKKRLSQRTVACFHAERTRFPDEERPGQVRYHWKLPLHHGWWTSLEPEVPIDWNDVNVIRLGEKPFGSK